MGEIGIPLAKYREFKKARDEALVRYAKKYNYNLDRLKANLKKHAENRSNTISSIYEIGIE